MAFWNKKMKDVERVRVYDPDTATESSIPAAELAPGMIRITVQGREGEFWADASRFKPSGYKHPPFNEQVEDILRDIMAKLWEVHPLSLEQWEDGFRRDTNAEREIAIWGYMAHVYSQVTRNRTLSPEHKKKLFEIILSCANNPREHILTVVDLGPVTRQEAEGVIAAFFKDEQRAS